MIKSLKRIFAKKQKPDRVLGSRIKSSNDTIQTQKNDDFSSFFGNW